MTPARSAKAALTRTPPDITPKALPTRDAARYSGYSEDFLRAARLGRCEGPPFVRIGRSIRYLTTDLDLWLEAHRVVLRATEDR